MVTSIRGSVFNMYDGYILYCNKTTEQQCLSRKRYTCADKKTKLSEQIKIGSVLFLYNLDDKSLLGPFTALSEGGKELDAGAWAINVDKHVPSEDVIVTWEDLRKIEDAPQHLPFLNDPKTCKLSYTQTQRVLDLLKQSPLYLYSKDQK
jgi:hypothetical protein